MTWGSACPKCGLTTCSWVMGRWCQGLVNQLESKYKTLVAALQAQQRHEERIRRMIDDDA